MKEATPKQMKEYKKTLKEEAKKFVLTSEDLSNLTDLYYMIDDETYGTIMLNKMGEWFDKFFGRVERITIPELYKKKSIVRRKKKMKIHTICKTELEMEQGESPGRGYGWWRCPKCDKRVPRTEITEVRGKTNGN